MSDDGNFDREDECNRELADPANDPVISASALVYLAEEAEKVGATRYAEAYRLVANQLYSVERGTPEGKKP